MKKCFAYLRVSTAKQGQKGVSLQEQKAAIERYAARTDLKITKWFEERESAAKRGRPVFTQMLRDLRRAKSVGLIIHKIDRGARNLRDWAELGELIDSGIKVHFANESLDVHSRGGRLSADIQAVVAADYIRNLREETLKGMYGRLKQGLLPFQAPLGYLDRGAGKAKEIDPVRAPLIRAAFELYDAGGHNLDTLCNELHRRGLRNRRGGRASRNGLSLILNNPFYAGLIRLRSTGETFNGVHTPIIPMALFKRVRNRLAGKAVIRVRAHDFLFRKIFRCRLCHRYLIGEAQKGHVYYRCHNRDCETRCLREEILASEVMDTLARLNLSDSDRSRVIERLDALGPEWESTEEKLRRNLERDLGACKDRLMRLTDAFIDGDIDKPLFNKRKGALLEEQGTLEDAVKQKVLGWDAVRRHALEALELASDAQLSFEIGTTEERRELLDIVSSNRRAGNDDVSVELLFPYDMFAEHELVTDGDPSRDATRTCDEMARILFRWAKNKALASRFGRVVA